MASVTATGMQRLRGEKREGELLVQWKDEDKELIWHTREEKREKRERSGNACSIRKDGKSRRNTIIRKGFHSHPFDSLVETGGNMHLSLGVSFVASE